MTLIVDQAQGYAAVKHLLHRKVSGKRNFKASYSGVRQDEILQGCITPIKNSNLYRKSELGKMVDKYDDAKSVSQLIDTVPSVQAIMCRWEKCCPQSKKPAVIVQLSLIMARRVASRPALSNNASSFPPVPRDGPLAAALSAALSCSSFSIIALTGQPHPAGGVVRDIDTMYKQAMRMCWSRSFFNAVTAASYGSRMAGDCIANARIGREEAAKCVR